MKRSILNLVALATLAAGAAVVEPKATDEVLCNPGMGFVHFYYSSRILPSEAQWEFAARAGNGAGYWGDGTPILNGSPDANLNRIGRYKGNLPGDNIAQTAAPSEGGTPIVGSYAPNKWGLYDMQGCVWECCLDWYQDDISVLNGAVNIKFDDPTQPATGTTMDGKRAARGGSMDSVAGLCRPGFRNAGYSANARQRDIGFRLVCTAGLK